MISTQVHAFFDTATNTLTYVVWSSESCDAVVIDPVLDYDPATQSVAQDSLNKVRQFVKMHGLNVHWILETHAHADHLSGARELKASWPGARWGMATAMKEVFENFRRVFSWPRQVQLEQLGVDRWFSDREEFTAGLLRVQVVATPGHTPACVTYRIDENLFTGDALMMPDGGTGRCDFPGGSAAQLYASIWGKLYALPDTYKVYVGHDYQPGKRPVRWQSTIGAEKANNIHLRANTAKADFVSLREARDKTLNPPRLLNPSLDWNLGAHQLVNPTK